MIGYEEKAILAEYMANMILRTPRGFARVQQHAPEIVETMFRHTEKYVRNFRTTDPHKFRMLEKLWEHDNRQKEEWKRNFPRKYWYSALRPHATSKIAEALSKMVWIFWFDEQPVFMTGDNPVSYSEDKGIASAEVAVSFPISSTIALEATNLISPMGFYRASKAKIQEINERTAHTATSYIYYCENSAWVSQLVNPKN